VNWDEQVLRGLVRKAIWNGKLFELLFSDQGKRLLASYPEKKVKKIVQQELKSLGGGLND